MSNSVPPSGPPSTAPVAPAATAPIRTTVLPAPNTPTLTQGQTLSARVVANANNQLVLQTDQGRITVQSPTTLPVGTTVSLQVNGAGPPQQITIQLQSGAPNGTVATLQNQTSAPAGSTSTPAVANPVTTQVTQGSVLQATVTAARENSAAANGAQTTTSNTAAPSATTSSLPPTLQSGTSLTLRILAAAPPAGFFKLRRQAATMLS